MWSTHRKIHTHIQYTEHVGCMCVSVLDAEREGDTSPSGLHMNHVYYIRVRERERHDTLGISSALSPVRLSQTSNPSFAVSHTHSFI